MIPQRAIDLIKDSESLRLTAYLCPAEVWTIGWGTTRYPNGSPVKQGDVISKEYAELCFRKDLLKFEYAVDTLTGKKLNQNQRGAVISFTYNLGENALRMSTLLRKINANPNDNDIKLEFAKWVYADGKKWGGLVTRRKKEIELYFSE